MQTLRWTGITTCALLAVWGLASGVNYLTNGGTHAVVVVYDGAWAALFAGFAGVLWWRGGPRWIGITVSTVFAMVGLAAGSVFFTGGFTQGVVPSWVGAALFTVVAVVLWRRGRRASF